MSAITIFRQFSFSMGRFGLESGADDRALPRAAAVSCLRTAVRLGSREASRIQRMVEWEAQDEVARTQSLHDPRPANGASLEPADAI